MMNDYNLYDLEERVYQILTNYFPAFTIRRTGGFGLAVGYDFIVDGLNGPILVVEVKRIQQLPPSRIDNILRKIHTFSNAQNTILTDGQRAYLACAGEKDIQITNDSSFSNVLSKIKTQYLTSIQQQPSAQSKPINQLLELGISETCSKENNEQKTKNKSKTEALKTFASSLQDSDFESEDQHNYFFKPDVERKFFKTLLGTYENKYMTRFSPARNLYIMLEQASLNMCSLLCMNDPSEKAYADEYTNITTGIDDANSVYILSGCNENAEEELTMWRLYADDAKGICIKYAIDSNKLEKNGFYLAPVSYSTTKTYHFELEVVKNFLSAAKQQGISISFRYWYIWKHFFKQYIYKDEKEVRLIYIPPKDTPYPHIAQKWFLDERTGVYSEMKIFSLKKEENNKYPLIVDTIYLGTKFPAQKTNVVQVNQCVQQSLIHINENKTKAVLPCEIEDYL